MKKQKFNWKPVSVAIGIALSLIGLASAWAVTASKTGTVEKAVEKVDKEVDEVDERVDKIDIYIAEQRVANQFNQQQTANIAEILKEIKKK